MTSFIRTHWQNLVFALASFFWVGCGDESSSTVVTPYGRSDEICENKNPEESSSSSVSSSSDETSSSSVFSSSSSVKSSSSSDDKKIPRMSSTAYGVEPVDCYSTTMQNNTGNTFDIIECDNGTTYLKYPHLYDEKTNGELPQYVQPNSPIKSSYYANNCEEVSLCIDGVDDEGKPTGGCYPILECPSKEGQTNSSNNQ